MSYLSKTIKEVVEEYVNRNTFLPDIQREYVWEPQDIEKLFDSIMCEYPIGSFLFWKIREEKKADWVSFEFIKNFNEENPHNIKTNLSGVNQDIYLVLDGQQRLTSLYIGLMGSYRYFYRKWSNKKLYLNLLKGPKKAENPEENTYQFEFRENDQPNSKATAPELWYLVGDILNHQDSEDAKLAFKERILKIENESLQDNARSLIGKLHSKICTLRTLNFYEEKSQDYDKVVEIFIRANTGGKKLEYSDILLSSATANWENLNAREEIYSFTDELNSVGTGLGLTKDFVLKGCLYLTKDLPIQYRIKNFTNDNLRKIESNWPSIKKYLFQTVALVSKFGYSKTNLTSTNALLPIALFLKKIEKNKFEISTLKEDIQIQQSIQKWLAIALLKNIFGGSSDSTLKTCQDIILKSTETTPFYAINRELGIEGRFSELEVDVLLKTNYATKYSYLILSLLYPDRDWSDKKFHEDHIYPKTYFTKVNLKKLNVPDDKINEYLNAYNSIANLELLLDSENTSKGAVEFKDWIDSRDENFKTRHLIPILDNYEWNNFLNFIEKRKIIIRTKILEIAF